MVTGSTCDRCGHRADLDMPPPYWPGAGSPQSVGLYLVLDRELMPFIGHAFVRLADARIGGMCGEFGALDRSAEESFRQKRHYDTIVRHMLKQFPGVFLRTEFAGDPAQGMEPDKCISLHFNPRHNHAA